MSEQPIWEREPWNAETDHITTYVTVHMRPRPSERWSFSAWAESLKDRLRVLWHGCVEIEAHTFTERHPGECRSESHVYVPKIRPPKPTIAGFADFEEMSHDVH